MRKLVISLILFLLLSGNSFAQIIDSAFYNWKVYEAKETELDYKKCYIISRPIKSDSDHSSRKDPYIMISRFQKDRIEEVSIFSGYEYKISSDIYLLVDDKHFSFATKGKLAWAKSLDEDIEFIKSLLNSTILKVRSDSSVGTYAIDEYSLKGIAKAYTRMRTICP